MNSIIEIIKKRRTIRVFKSEQLKDEDIAAIVEAGSWAPSGHNMQPWHFTVLQNSEIIEELNKDSKKAAENFYMEDIRKMAQNEKFHVFYKAPTVIIVSYDKNGLTPVQDISAATQNMLLTAESMGIGSCWNGFVAFAFSNEEIAEKYRNKLEIPEGYVVSHAVALGYPNTTVLRGPERKKEIVNYIK